MVSFETVIVGGGLFGLSVGCQILESRRSENVCILERGIFPSGASTKNAGFGCFSSFTEFLKEVELFGIEKAVAILRDRVKGLQLLYKRVGNKTDIIRFSGSYEVIKEAQLPLLAHLGRVNSALREIFNEDVYVIDNSKIQEFGLNTDVVKALVFKKYEWQINSGKLVKALVNKFTVMGGRYLTGTDVKSYQRTPSGSIDVFVRNPASETNDFLFTTTKLIFCTNSFISQIQKDSEVFPVREEVMITKPIPNLKIHTNLEVDEGLYYLRPVEGRLLIGGGADLNAKSDQNFEFKNTDSAKTNLIRSLKELIPSLDFEVDYFWSGIQGFSKDKTRFKILKLSENVYSVFGCAGLGVSIASIAAERTFDLVFKQNHKL
jgi:gamma-glutamylputrescine oxidase